MTVADHFEEHFETIPNCGCWLWTAALNAYGYGVLRSNGKSVLAHRFGYQKYVGHIPSGLDVLHDCDTPCCVNPQHLRLGTHAENMADKMRKGRHRYGEGKRWTKENHPVGNVLKGEANPAHKLTEEMVLSIRKDNRPQRTIAIDYGVSWQLIGKIKRRERWS